MIHYGKRHPLYRSLAGLSLAMIIMRKVCLISLGVGKAVREYYGSRFSHRYEDWWMLKNE